MQATLEVSKQIRAILRIEDVQDKRAVIHKILEPLNNILTPFIIEYLMRERLVRILLENPFEEIINIVKVIIESLAIYAALFNKVFYCNLINRLHRQHFLQSIAQGFFC